MLTKRFLQNKIGAQLTSNEQQRLEAAFSEVRALPARKTIVRAGEKPNYSTLLVDGIISRFIDDREGLRQLVALHFPGEFVDLHAYPLRVLDHSVGTMTAATVAIVPHRELDGLMRELPDLTRKLWFSTLMDAAMHRAWLFRLGRLDALGRVAHFLCETDARLMATGLSDGRQFRLELTQSDIAEVCGLTNIHVNRVMRQLREQQLCTFRSSQVELLDPVRLAARGQFDPGYLYIDPAYLSPAPVMTRRSTHA